MNCLRKTTILIELAATAQPLAQGLSFQIAHKAMPDAAIIAE
jgi:hypothetical protein